MITLNDIIDFCRAEALAGKLYPSEVSDWRWFCREYSKTFHTPLHLVLEMDPEHVVLCVLEEGLDGKRLRNEKDVESIIDELRRLEDPDYESSKRMDDWAAGIEEWDDAREAAGLPVPKTNATVAHPEPSLQPKEMPKEGGINLAYLAKEDQSDPDNGFDE